MKISFLLSLTYILITFCNLNAQKQKLKVSTWNIEHLGDAGRGFPEIYNQFPMRTDEQLNAIASLIKDTLNLDIVAIQEVSLSKTYNGKSYSNELYQITQALGDDWNYYLASVDPKIREPDMQNAFIYNTAKVELASVFEMPVPDYNVGPKSLFDRVPLVGYFKSTNSKVKNPGFVIVNLHLASGKDNDENHLAAMVMVEQNLSYYMGQNHISNREQDRIILGDFNDNPHQLKSNGEPAFIQTLYNYMELKGYKDYVDQSFESTRMSKNFNSIIDHILVKKQLHDNIREAKATMYLPPDRSDEGFKKWRATYSDHFPMYIELLMK
ncbi:endonuclease/exonuclease/phosphatase family protein [Saccharicrinis aurantiacus]|uniref:endonuclease/exonuclease/phosphatase family protein n=1 Tax=Saccharicrinis aurantiacus TaxID=1849719 RepID=UPI00094F5B49|nr:endonuclease/exonuclease/phosphatase family protein [Saccharicrinis aurantiacus]